MTIVVDASVVLKWLLQDPEREEATDDATALMEVITSGQIEVIQPFHWLAEIAAVLSRLSPKTAADDVIQVQALNLPTTDEPAVLRRACQLATRHRAHAFDTLYHAVALEHAEARLITADVAYYRAARASSRILMLGDWRSATA